MKHYCSQKFWWLSVNLQRMETMNCGSATPHGIEHVDGTDIFNTQTLQKERQDMLSGKKVDSCYATCWRPEASGLPSRRTTMGGELVTHTDVYATPDVLQIILGNQCNMTCSYCCKQYSSSWYNDIRQNGSYDVETSDDRFKINLKDQVLPRISQKKLSNSGQRPLILEQLANILKKKQIREVQITGGEPFLYPALNDILDDLQPQKKFNIYSGLGVNPIYFEKQIKNLKKNKKDIIITVSAEGTEHFYEFNRAGNTWKRFKENIECIKRNGIEYRFSSILSNLTVFGLPQFEEFAQGKEIHYQPCGDPDYLSVHVLDNNSKKSLMEEVLACEPTAKKIISESIFINPTEIQHKNFSKYVHEFALRKNKSLSIFPKTMVDWITQSN